jgi:hypothetical protein
MAVKKPSTEKSAPAKTSGANKGSVIAMTGAKANTPKAGTGKKPASKAATKK